MKAVAIVFAMYTACVWWFVDDSNHLVNTFATGFSAEALQFMAVSLVLWLTVAAMALEHVCYSWLWKDPHGFRKTVVRIFGDRRRPGCLVHKPAYSENPTKAVHVVLIVNKFLQFFAVLGMVASMWWGANSPLSSVPSTCNARWFGCLMEHGIDFFYLPLQRAGAHIITKTPTCVWLLSLPLILVGQVLNFAVYRAIGKVIPQMLYHLSAKIYAKAYLPLTYISKLSTIPSSNKNL